MSFNDRCGEAAEIIRHGGVIPNTNPFRDALVELLEHGRDGYGTTPDRDFVYAILEHPDNAALRAQAIDGQWYGDPRTPEEQAADESPGIAYMHPAVEEVES